MKADRFVVSISIKADQDLRTLADYVARERSIDDAVELVDSVRLKVDTLEQFPNRGSIPEEVRALGDNDVRQIFVGPYRIFTLVGDRHVTIFLIADGRRDMVALLTQRLTGV